MILTALNKILETDYQTEQEAVDALTQPWFVKNHINPSRKFLEIYYGIFNTPPVDESFMDGFDAVYVLAETYGKPLNKELYTQGMNLQNYLYEKTFGALDLPKLKRDYEQYVENYNPTRSQKERYLTDKLAPSCKLPYARKNFIETKVLNYETAQVVKQVISKHGATHQRYCMDYFEEGLTVFLPHTLIYSLLCTLITLPVMERKCLPDDQLNYLQAQLIAMDNPVFNEHWETSRNMAKSAKNLLSLEDDVKQLAFRYVATNLSYADFQKRLAFDSELVMIFLVAGLRYNSICMLQYVALVMQTIRDYRAKFGMI